MPEENNPQEAKPGSGTFAEKSSKHRRELSMKKLLDEMIQKGSSDLHITVGSPPVFRVDGQLQRMSADVVTEDAAKRFAYSIMTEKQKQQFEENWEVDLSFGMTGLFPSRFRHWRSWGFLPPRPDSPISRGGWFWFAGPPVRANPPPWPPS